MEIITRILYIIMVFTFTLFAIFDGSVRELVILGTFTIIIHVELIEIEINKKQ